MDFHKHPKVKDVSDLFFNGTLYVSTTPVGTTTGSVEQNLILYNVPANLLTSDGDSLEMKASGILTGDLTAWTYRIKPNVDGTVISSMASKITTNDLGYWQCTVSVTRKSATNASVSVYGLCREYSPAVAERIMCYTGDESITFSGSWPIAMVGYSNATTPADSIQQRDCIITIKKYSS